jgi:perosamine synthetase
MSTAFLDEFKDKVRSVTGANDGEFVALHEPEFQGEEWTYVKDCIDTGWVSSVGQYVDRFEDDLAEFMGVKHAIAVVNGTAALQLALVLAGVQPHDEVLVPALSFVATANAVMHANATPHFIDSNVETLGVDPEKLDAYLEDIGEPSKDGLLNRKTGKRIAAIICMHTFGHPVQLDELVAVCERYRVPLVEDAAESMGSYYKGRHTGNSGLVSAVSFNGNKIVTTGGGGAVVTNSDELAALAKHLSTTAKIPHKWEFEHDMVGYNYRMPNLNAALGCAQLEVLPKFLAEKRTLAARYSEAFDSMDEITFLMEPPETKSNYWLCAIRLNSGDEQLRNEILETANTAGLMMRPIWRLLPSLKIYSEAPCADISVARELVECVVCLPSSPKLGRTGQK